MKTYADKRVMQNIIYPRRWHGVAASREEKQVQYSIEGIPYSVFQKKGSIVTAERITGGRMVTRNAKVFKSCPPSIKERTQAALLDKLMMQLLLRSHQQLYM